MNLNHKMNESPSEKKMKDLSNQDSMNKINIEISNVKVGYNDENLGKN